MRVCVMRIISIANSLGHCWTQIRCAVPGSLWLQPHTTHATHDERQAPELCWPRAGSGCNQGCLKHAELLLETVLLWLTCHTDSS